MQQLKHSIPSIRLFINGASIILTEFGNLPTSTKTNILRCSLARTIKMLESILHLYFIRNINDGWILYRALIERLGHLYALEENNSYEAFDKWSFIKQYEANQNANSDTNIDISIPISKEDRKKYNELKRADHGWRRPKCEDIFAQKDLSFLYKYGYHWASAHVHPMANEGDLEYLLMSGGNTNNERLSTHWENGNILLNNSCLITALIVQNCLNSSDANWRRLVYNFLDSFLENKPLMENEFMKLLTLKDTGTPFFKT